MSTPIAKRIDPLRVYQLKVEQGLNYNEIGKILGVSHVAVMKRYQKLLTVLPDKEQVKVYIDNKPTILQGAELSLVGSLLNKGKQKKASLNNVAYALTQVSQLRRLEEGKSTMNIGLHTTLVLAAEAEDKPVDTTTSSDKSD